MIVAEGPVVLLKAVGQGLGNVAFAASLIVCIVMAVAVVVYSKRRPADAPLSWGTAMVGSVYVTFGLVMAFGILPDRWMAHAEGNLKMRSDAILAGPGSTGWFKGIPVVVSKSTIADLVAITIYGIAMVVTVLLWAVWQKRGQKVSEEIETSPYGRPLVKA